MADHNNWDLRADGSKKGEGFLGALQRPDKTVSSEISVGVPLNGKETDIPSLVPTLTQEELDFLLKMDMKTGRMPNSIVQKAITHAQGRQASGQSVWAQPGEQQYHIYPQFHREDAPTTGFNDAAITPQPSHLTGVADTVQDVRRKAILAQLGR